MADVSSCKKELAGKVEEFVRAGFTPRFGELKGKFPSNPMWKKLKELGTELWLDTGNIEEIDTMWTEEFSAVTTNNTLLNKEIQRGVYDDTIKEAARLLDAFPQLTPQERKLELAFILNARHGLKLVERFDAYVSVEEHTDLTNDLEGSVEYARRYNRICPERFIVKIPLSPAGILATRRVAAEGIPVNHTLGFSARQNYVIARVGAPAFVNVFLGRLNSFAADNRLGDGALVGERATLATQAVIRGLRDGNNLKTRLIGASFRGGRQVRDLAGIDVMTMPPKVAGEFLKLGLDPEELACNAGRLYEPVFDPGANPKASGLMSLWDVDPELPACVDALEKQHLDAFSAEQFTAFFAEHGFANLFVPWTEEEVRASAREGKIPLLGYWGERIGSGEIGLDALMNLAGWTSFNEDQKAMDKRVADVLGNCATSCGRCCR